MTHPSKTLLWLEDAPKTVVEDIAFVQKQIFHVKRVSQLHTFANILNDSLYNVEAIILDIMLYGVEDLSALNIESVDTHYGYQAGWRVLEHYLRAPDSKFREIPVLIYSVRDLSDENKALLEKLRQQGDAPIDFIGKYQSMERGRKEWHYHFKDWIRNVARGY